MKDHDLRLVAPAMAAWLAAAVALGAGRAVAYGVAGAAVVAVVLAVRRRSAARRWCTLALTCAAASAAGVGLRATAVESGPVRDLADAGGRAAVEAVVTADPRQVAGRRFALIRMRAETVDAGGRRTRVRVPILAIAADRRWTGLLPSQRVRFTGRFAPPRRAELLAAVVVVRGPPDVLGPASTVQRAAEHVRARLRLAVARLPPSQRGVLPGMVVGDTSRLDPRLAEDFRTAGLTHLLVVSGANLAIVVGAVLGLCRLAGLGRRRAPFVAALAVPVFVVVARPEPSVLRATVMGLIGLLAMFTGRRRQGVPALCAAVLFLVLIDPTLARSYGFALSVLATAGLLVLAPPWRERLRRRVPGPLADALAVAAAAQVAVAPVLVMLSGEVGLVAVLANLLAAPAVPPATLLGAAATVIALLWPEAAQVVVRPAGLTVGWIVWVARTAAGLPYATIPWRGGGLGALALLAAGGCAVLILKYRRARLVAAAAMAGTLVAVAGLRILSPGWPPPGWMMVACDVGQGDALVLSTAPGQAVVVDTGPEPRPVDACLDRLGVRDVPLLVLTHPHADHVEGFAGVRDGRSLHTVLTTPLGTAEEVLAALGPATRTRCAEPGDARPSPARSRCWAVARPAVAGQRWQIGELTLAVLGPAATGPRLTRNDDGAAVNNASVVLLARRPGFSALLAGDVEPEAQRVLLGVVPPVQVLKVPHHGSRKQEPQFLAATHAEISIISVGRDNDYGHPSTATMDMLRRLGMRIHRTDEDGDIAVVRTAAGLAVVTRR
ncbi:competence protein ComEC [Actinomadura sp. NBRC 104425]|uniref:ComEC/Rec2 family competence protein n=1 Tax=Actinomadura sp. NBRC 104425 TaxID=3032204 RepID=UPI0024A035A9|nr:ComEC/Rec2 family competence protein [Actinomadura sp. NBRC 104425]GLZ11061.1 competence protein ComEC [Actinomadura sp. NBRC 104425]